MRIIHVMESFEGGNFEFLSTLTQELKDNEYIIFHGNRDNTPLNYCERFPYGTVFIPWKNAGREINFIADIRALMELIGFLKKYSSEESIIHLHSSKAGFLGRLAAWLLRKSNRVVYTAHGAAFLRLDVNRLKHYLYVALEKIGSWFGGTIVACSQSESKKFNKYGINNIVTINNGIKIEEEQVNNKKLSDQIVIGTLARITHQKNPKQFNEIAEHFIDDARIKFLWIGDGELRHELKESNIEITGWLDKKQVKKRLRELDVYLSTSLWEGLPLSVLEAMALKKTLVLSDCVGNRDLVQENGFIYSDVCSAVRYIKLLLSNRKLLDLLGNKSQKIVQSSYFLKDTSRKYKAIYMK